MIVFKTHIHKAHRHTGAKSQIKCPPLEGKVTTSNTIITAKVCRYRRKQSQENEYYTKYTDYTKLSKGLFCTYSMFYLVLISKVFSVDEKQFCGHWGKGVYPCHCDSFYNSILQVQEFPWVWPTHDAGGRGGARAVYNQGRYQSTDIGHPQGCRSSPHLTTRPDAGNTRKKHSLIMTGKVVAAGMALLLISVIGTKGKEILPNTLISNC